MTDDFEILQTVDFDRWLGELRDGRGRARMLDRIERLAAGNFGDVKPVGGQVSELRMHFGPGYRIYFTRVGRIVILLLAGGDKASQARDIMYARKLVEDGSWKSKLSMPPII